MMQSFAASRRTLNLLSSSCVATAFDQRLNLTRKLFTLTKYFCIGNASACAAVEIMLLERNRVCSCLLIKPFAMQHSWCSRHIRLILLHMPLYYMNDVLGNYTLVRQYIYITHAGLTVTYITHCCATQMYMMGQFMMLRDCCKHCTYQQTVSLCIRSVSKDLWYFTHVWKICDFVTNISINQSISMNLLWRPTSKALGCQKYSENTTA